MPCYEEDFRHSIQYATCSGHQRSALSDVIGLERGGTETGEEKKSAIEGPDAASVDRPAVLLKDRLEHGRRRHGNARRLQLSGTKFLVYSIS